MSVGGLLRPAMRGQNAGIAGWPIARLKSRALQMLGQHEGRHGFEHRDLDMLAAAVPLAVEQRHADRREHGQSDHFVSHHRIGVTRPAAIYPLQRRDAAGGLDNVVIGGFSGIRPGFAKAIGAAVDKIRIDLPQGIVVQAEPAHRVRPDRGRQDIGGSDQLKKRLFRTFLL